MTAPDTQLKDLTTSQFEALYPHMFAAAFHDTLEESVYFDAQETLPEPVPVRNPMECSFYGMFTCNGGLTFEEASKLYEESLKPSS